MLSLLGGICLLGVPALAEDVPRMTKEELRPLLGRESVVVIDTRAPEDWGASQGKIPGAVRRPPNEVASWADDLPRTATIVVYCA
jgi:rhodanese-related sulfurtransferase